MVLYVEDLNEATARAVGYVRSFAGGNFRAVHVPGPDTPRDIPDRWRAFSRTDVELEVLPPTDRPTEAIVEFVRAFTRGDGDFITVVIPELHTRKSLVSAVRRGTSFLLKVRLLREPQVVIADAPVVRESGERQTELRPLIPERVEVLVFVSAVHDASIRAINYARSLRAPDTRAVYFAFDPSQIDQIQSAWERAGIPIALDIVEAPFRDLTAPVLQEVRAVTSKRNSIAVVIVPELVVKKWWHNSLHNQRPLFLKRLLLFEPDVILTSVPYQLR